jgi:hypothetical protein
LIPNRDLEKFQIPAPHCVEQPLPHPSPPFLVMNSTLNVGMGLFRRHLIKKEEEVGIEN